MAQFVVFNLSMRLQVMIGKKIMDEASKSKLQLEKTKAEQLRLELERQRLERERAQKEEMQMDMRVKFESVQQAVTAKTRRLEKLLFKYQVPELEELKRIERVCEMAGNQARD